MRLGQFAAVGQDLGDVHARECSIKHIAELHGLRASALVVRQRLVPASFPLADDAEIRQQRRLPQQVARTAVRLQRALQERLRALLAEHAVSPAHHETRGAERLGIVGRLRPRGSRAGPSAWHRRCGPRPAARWRTTRSKRADCRAASSPIRPSTALRGARGPTQRLRILAELFLQPGALEQQLRTHHRVAGDQPTRGHVAIRRLGELAGPIPAVGERLVHDGQFLASNVGRGGARPRARARTVLAASTYA